MALAAHRPNVGFRGGGKTMHFGRTAGLSRAPNLSAERSEGLNRAQSTGCCIAADLKRDRGTGRSLSEDYAERFAIEAMREAKTTV